MSHKFTLGIGFALSLALAGCGSSAATTQTVTMNAIATSGQNGTAVLVDTGDGKTSVTLATTGGTDTGSQAAHIHQGVCGSAGPVVYPLANVQNGGSTMSVATTLAGITGGKFYINIHNSKDPSIIQTCGQIQ